MGLTMPMTMCYLLLKEKAWDFKIQLYNTSGTCPAEIDEVFEVGLYFTEEGIDSAQPFTAVFDLITFGIILRTNSLNKSEP
jgi:hypothetical protein